MARSKPYAYGSFVANVIDLWTQVCIAIEVAGTPEQYQTVFDHLMFLRQAITAWPIEALELRHQQALLTLVEDTALWAEAASAGSDREAAVRDLYEATMGVRVEMRRLAAARPHCFNDES